MKCDRARELFSDYLEGGTDYALTDMVRCHLDQCASCREEYASFREVWSMLETTPKVEPPADFRHNVVMRVAGMQHVQARQSRPRGTWSASWDHLFGWLLSTRGLATAAAGVLLAAVLFTFHQTNVNYSANPGMAVRGYPAGQRMPAQVRNTELPQTMGTATKSDWESHKMLRNALWITVKPHNGPDGVVGYGVALSINNSALVEGKTVSSIPAQVYVMPQGRFDLGEVKAGGPQWQGTVGAQSADAPSVIVNQSMNLLVVYQVEGREFSRIVMLPSRVGSSGSVYGLNAGSAGYAGQGVYPVLDRMSRDYAVPVIVNGSLKSGVCQMLPGDGRLGDELQRCLRPMGLDWLFADGAVYVDRTYRDVDAE